MLPPDPSESPLKQGIVMFFSFLIFGFVPLFAYIFLSGVNFKGQTDPRFGVACAFTVIALFTLGALKV